MKTISKRFLKASLAMLLVVIMLLSSTITGFAASVDNADTKASVDIAETSAITFTSDDILFFNMKAVSWWSAGTNGNGNFAYFYNNSTGKNAWSAHAVHYDGNYYYVKIPAGTWEGVILTRNNTSTAPSWNNKWNQTGDITLQSEKNYISSFSENSTTATWSTYKPISDVSLTASLTNVNTNTSVTLTPSLTTNETFNEITSTTYTISPSAGASISGNTFTATTSGDYTVSANIKYNARGYSTLTTDKTATVKITVKASKYSYSVESNDTKKGTVSYDGDGTVDIGSTVTVTATPKDGYKFDGWTSTTGTFGNANSLSTTFEPSDDNAKATANFSAITKKITYVTYTGDTATYTPNSYSLDNATVTLPTKVEQDKHVFEGWYDNSNFTGSPIKTFTPTADTLTDKTFYAKFSKLHHILVGAIPEDLSGGKVSITGYTGNYADVVTGTELELTAKPETGYNFKGWTIGDDVVSTANPYTYTVVTSDATLIAVFEKKQYTINTAVSPAGAGTATVNGKTSDTVLHGDEITLKAVADDKHIFDYWKRDDIRETSVQDEFTIPAEGSATFTAVFVNAWKVNVTVPDEGLLDVGLNADIHGDVSYELKKVKEGTKYNPTVTLTDDTYEHRGWKVRQNGKTTTHTENAIEVTINSDTTIEPIVVKTFKATSAVYTTHVKVANGHPYGGTVSINNNEPNATATVDRGSAVKYVAEPYTNYEFIGWYKSEKDFKTSDPISTNLEYTLTESAAGDMHLVALFARIYKVSGAYNGTFKYNSKTNTYSFVADNYSVGSFNILSDNGTVDTDVNNGGNTLGGTLDGTNSPFTFTIGEDFDTAKPITFELTSNNSGLTFVLDITAQYRNAHNVTFASDIDGEGAGSYLEGKPVLLTINCDVDQAIAGFSFKTGNGFVAPSDATKVGDKQISFTMPEGDVELDVQLAKMYKVYADTTADTGLTENAKYYLPGEDIVYPLTPTSAKVSIMTDTIALVPRTEFTSTLGANGVVNLLFTMPNEDVKVQAVTKASYQVNVVTDIKDYFDTNGADYCSVEVKAFGITDDNYVANNTTVTLKATSKQGNNQDYTFLGYYDDEGKLISENPVYSFIPQDDINYKAVFVRNVYIVGDIAEGEDVFTPMEYDMDTDTYSYVPDIANGSFKITPIADPDSTEFNTEWGRTTVTYVGVNNTSKGVLNGLKSNYTMPLSITFSKANVASYRAQVSAKEVAANVYLSSGRLDYDRRKSTYFSTNTQFIDYEGEYTVGEKHNAINESYIPANLPQKNMTVRVQTTISGSTQNLYDVEYFYIYDVESGKPSAVAATPLGGGVYEASIEVKGTSFIVPLFFANQNYLNAVGGKRVQIYVDPREIIDDTSINWGKFMACYPYGRSTGENNDHDLTGHWPGQLMIPLDDGTFKTSVVIGDGTNETLSGLVFNNYLSTEDSDRSAATLIKSELGMSGLGFVQTYDYKEAVYLDKGGFDVITYKLKKNNDGYHGNRMDNTNNKHSIYRVYANQDINLTATNYKFAPLMDRHNRYPMDFNGVSIKTANPTTAYYVVVEGDVDVDINNTYDPLYSGDWTAIWHVYNADGKYLCNVMSGGMYDQVDATHSKLANALGVTNKDLEGKQVMITYEAKNKTNYYRVDGQWYGEKTAESNINASIIVGLYDGANFHENILDNPDTPNINENYGQAFINHEGGREQSVELKYVTGSSAIKVDLSAERFGNYKIKGWYTKNANGDYVEFQKGGSSASLTIGGDTVIYAFFEPLAGDQLVVDHEIYSNTTDLEILSGNGTGERTVEIWSYDPVTKKAIAKLDGSTSINGSSASTAVKENESYLIRVKVNPLGADKFHAWYMAAERADGTSTFEEVFTDGSTVNSENEVVSEFVYTFKPDMPTHIVIYSDLKEISVNGKLIYIYKNRYGNERFITQTIKMTPEEIDGFAGNDNKSRLPAYKDYLIYEKEIDGILVKEKVYTQERADELLKEDYEIAGDGNQIGEYLPNLNVTEAVNISTEWFVDEKYYTFKQEDSIIEIRAEQNPLTFHLTATVDGETYTKSGPYNSLIENLKCSDGSTIQYLDAPLKNKKGESFSYWQSYEEVAGVKFTKIISYSPYYRYRLIEDRTIEAVYGEDVTDAWTPSIEDVTYTREYGDGGDYIYTDYLVAFHSSIDEKLEDIKKDTTRPFEFGLVLIRDPKVTVTDDNYKTFSDYPTYDGIENDVKAVAEGGTSIKVYDEKNNNKDYNAYYFEFSDEPVTNFNRLVHAIKYDNKHKNNYKSYAFSAYAYLIIDGHTYISTPENVNFYELAIEKVTDK